MEGEEVCEGCGCKGATLGPDPYAQATPDTPAPVPIGVQPHGGDRLPPAHTRQHMTESSSSSENLVVIAGDSGVYAGMLVSSTTSADGSSCVVTLRNARHLRRYYVAGRTGDGSALDLAARGLDPQSPSISGVLPGLSTLLGVRRVFDVPGAVAGSFGVPAL